MTERDLENLSKVPVPLPRANARKAALDAALAAFDEAHTTELENETSVSKGRVVTLGQTETTRTKRSFRMHISSRQGQALAASLAALVIAAPIAFHQLSTRGLPNPGDFTALKDAGAPRPSQTAANEPRRVDLTARVEEKTGADVPAAAPTDAKTEGSVTSTPPALQSPSASEAPAPFGTANVEERAAEIDATTGRKGNRKTEITVTPPANMPSEVAQGLGQSAAPSEPGRIQLGKESLAADNARLGTDFSGTLFPGNGVTFDGGSLTQGGAAPAPQGQSGIAKGDAASNAYLEKKKSGSTSIAMTPPPPAPAARMVKPAAPAVAMSRLGAQDARRERNDPYAWMGTDTDERIVSQVQEENRDKFDAKEINPVKQVASEPVSTFSIDVDTASYSFVRRALNAGHLPPKDAVRVEEMVNYFPYAYPAPETAETPFKPTVTVFNAPWNTSNKLVHVAIKGYDLKSAERPRANLVLLMDVSGSMQGEDRLPLVKNAFRLLVDQLQPDDTIGIVTYASGSGIALEPTKVADKSKILAAIDRLNAGGSTAGAAGITDAYRLAESNFDKSAVNRIILATDGDFNVGITDQNELKGFIERKRQSGIFLSILGVGQGNHNDALMQTLAQNGNGTAAYVDTLNEARKVLVDESSSTLFTIAKDVKIQIEWNPQRVSEYRLIGYETRNLKREDFNNDRVDAGDIGSGHTVTAIYEVTPTGAPKLVDDLRYAAKPAAKPSVEAPPATTAEGASNELGFLKLRYKRPKEDVSQLVSLPIPDASATPDAVSNDVRFSTAVAAFGQMLKGEPYTQSYNFDDVLKLAQGARVDDPFGYRADFLNLVRLAKSARP